MLSCFFALFLVSLARGQRVVGLFSQFSNSHLPNVTIFSGIEGNGRGLECLTDFVSDNQEIGTWYGPDGSEIQKNTFQSFYRLPSPYGTTLYKTGGLSDMNDEGIFTCVIPDSNGVELRLYAGIYTEQNYQNGLPVISSFPSFTLQTSLSTFPPSFSLSFVSSRFPPTYVNWTRDGVPIEINDEGDTYQSIQYLKNAITTTFDNLLIVTGRYLPGNYTCTMSNSQGDSSAFIIVRAPNGPPANITTSFLGAGNVSVSWTPPTGDIDGYQLYYQQLNGSDGGIVNITGPNTSVILRSLLAGATYSISMIGYADLPSDLSDTIMVTLNIAGSPESVSVASSVSDATVLFVDWEEPQNGSSNVVGYIVEYEATNKSTNCPGVPGGTINNIQNTSVLLTGLEEYTEYSVTIRTISVAAVGEPSIAVTAATSTGAPAGPPLSVDAIPINPNQINITWDPPLCNAQNGPIRYYTVHRRDLSVGFRDTPLTISGNEQFSTVVRDLPAFRNFSFTISVANDNGSMDSATVYAHLISIPDQVRSLGSAFVGITTIVVSWDLPRENNRPIETVFTKDFSYIIEWYFTPDDPASTSLGEVRGQDEVPSSQSFGLLNLLPNTSYRVFVYAKSTYGQEMVGVSIDQSTRNIVGIDLERVIEVNSTSLNVSWSPSSSSDIILYTVYYNTSANPNAVMSVNVTGYQSSVLTLSGLDNSLVYTFSIAGVVNTTENGTIEGPVSTRLSFSFTQHSNIRLILIISGSIVGGLVLLVIVIVITVVILTLLNRSIGPRFAVRGEEGYLLVPLDASHDLETTPPSNRPVKIGTTPTEIHAVEGQEVVMRVCFRGDPMPTLSWKQNGEEIDWENASFALRDGAIVFPYVEVIHSGDYEVTATNTNGSDSVPITLTVYPETDLMAPSQKEGEILSVRIPLEEFGQYVTNLHANNNKLFREQFKRLTVPELSTMVAWSEENRQFNRNQNIIPYDDNLIGLDPLSRFLDCHHTYINASRVLVGKDQESCQKFIATQGPLDRTVVDFWRLVWQEKVCAVVMLTKLQEDLRIKCSQYWPSKGSEDYGPFTVTLQKEAIHNSFVVRELTVHYNTMIGNLRSKIVNPTGKIDPNKREYFSSAQSTLVLTHYQFTDWPEHGSAPRISSLLSFHKVISSQTERKKGPIVVHCSAGSGRTGAYITMSAALKEAETESIIDIPAIVTLIRQQRMMMIQTLDQYMLVHEAVLEEGLCGNTQVFACDLQSTITSLSTVNTGERVSGFEAQFNVLEQVSVSQQDAVCDIAKQNSRKNRNQNILPTDQWRVPLKSESPDYINATYIPGYKTDRGFIIAQSPLRETRRDFWKMVFDREITTLVMLSPVMEGGEEVCAQYWPNEGNVEFDEYTVSVKEEWSHDSFSRKLLLVRNKKNNMLRRLAHFQVDGWSNDGFTSCNDMAIVNTINLVKTVQRKNPNIPILVHCSNMIGRSAMFCAAMATIDQMRSERIADVFQAVKAIRMHLPGAVENKEQYKMIHSLAAAYINLFSTAANF